MKIEESPVKQQRKFQGPKVNAKRARKEEIEVGLPLEHAEVIAHDEPSKVELPLTSPTIGGDAVPDHGNYTVQVFIVKFDRACRIVLDKFIDSLINSFFYVCY